MQREGDPPTRAATLHESERTRISRLDLAGGTVIRKEPLGSDADRRLRHELAILERLRGVPGVAQLVEPPAYYPDGEATILLADVHGTSLAERTLRGLALAGQVRRTAGGDERTDLLSELDDVVHWLGARAADAPDNFLHLQRLVEAERAWAVGDFRATAVAFDAARREAALRQRPWHRALIAERAARFFLDHASTTPGTNCSPRPAPSTPRGAPPRRPSSWTGPTRHCGHPPSCRIGGPR